MSISNRFLSKLVIASLFMVLRSHAHACDTNEDPQLSYSKYILITEAKPDGSTATVNIANIRVDSEIRLSDSGLPLHIKPQGAYWSRGWSRGGFYKLAGDPPNCLKASPFGSDKGERRADMYHDYFELAFDVTPYLNLPETRWRQVEDTLLHFGYLVYGISDKRHYRASLDSDSACYTPWISNLIVSKSLGPNNEEMGRLLELFTKLAGFRNGIRHRIRLRSEHEICFPELCLRETSVLLRQPIKVIKFIDSTAPTLACSDNELSICNTTIEGDMLEILKGSHSAAIDLTGSTLVGTEEEKSKIYSKLIHRRMRCNEVILHRVYVKRECAKNITAIAGDLRDLRFFGVGLEDTSSLDFSQFTNLRKLSLLSTNLSGRELAAAIKPLKGLQELAIDLPYWGEEARRLWQHELPRWWDETNRCDTIQQK